MNAMRPLVFGSVAVLMLAWATGLAGAELGRDGVETYDKVRKPSAAATGFQLAIFNPVQLFSEPCDVYGLRLDLPYGKNNALNGLDLGVVNQLMDEMRGIQIGLGNISGPMYGMQLAGANVALGEMVGWQMGGLNASKTVAAGLQTGAVNIGAEYNGLQIGGFNFADEYSGVQIGVVNVCNTLTGGIQVGALNFILNGQYLLFCPVVNISF